jgi:hypothetical protein
MTRKLKVPALVALLVLLGLPWTAAALEEDFAETFALSPDGRVSLDNVNGRVEIQAWDSAEVKVEYTKKAQSRAGLERMKVRIDASQRSIHVETDYEDSGRGFWRDSGGEVEYRLWVPRQARLDAVELVNGDLEIRGVEGDVNASLVNGDLIASGLGGDLELETVNGTIEVTLDRLRPGSDVSLESVNGRVEVVLPAGANADVRAETVHGRIRNDFGLDEKRERYGVGRSLSGTVGSGGARVDLETVNGSIDIRSQ